MGCHVDEDSEEEEEEQKTPPDDGTTCDPIGKRRERKTTSARVGDAVEVLCCFRPSLSLLFLPAQPLLCVPRRRETRESVPQSLSLSLTVARGAVPTRSHERESTEEEKKAKE